MPNPDIDLLRDSFPKARSSHPMYKTLYQAASTIPPSAHCYTMAKPTGSVCNLDCRYCFYLEKEKLYPERQLQWRMSDETLQRYIEQQVDAQASGQVVFSWQGGEPTMMGVAFYRKAFEMQNAYVAKVMQRTNRPISVVNTFQTNGILLDEAWMELFKTYSVLVGVSIDGPQELHDLYRVKRNGSPTFERVMAAISMLKQHGIPFNTLTVVHRENAKCPREVYEFLVGIGSDFLQFIPLVERESEAEHNGLKLVLPDEAKAKVTPWSLLPSQFGEFLSEIFDLWVMRDVGKVFVQMFDSTLASHLGYPATLCSHAAQCGSNFALEANGDVYACDHYVYPEHYLGNLNQHSLAQINHSVENRAFGLAKLAQLSESCQRCPVRFACHGGCPKHRFVFKSGDSLSSHYLCPSYAHFFSHTREKMVQMTSLIVRGMPPENIMK